MTEGVPSLVRRDSSALTAGRCLVWALVPLLLLAAVLAWIVRSDAGLGERTVPPIETLSVQRVWLPAPGTIELNVRQRWTRPDHHRPGDGRRRLLAVRPGAGGQTLDRLQSATISIPYPWVEGETHAIALVSSTGVLFDAEIPVAVESPQPDRESFARFALVGLYVGIVPIALGLLWYPFLRRLGRTGMNFVLALTVGLLAFLVVDMWHGGAGDGGSGGRRRSTPRC